MVLLIKIQFNWVLSKNLKLKPLKIDCEPQGKLRNHPENISFHFNENLKIFDFPWQLKRQFFLNPPICRHS